MVYAVAGLLEPWADGKLVIAYTKSIREVYCEAIRLILEQYGADGMRIFCDMFQIPQPARIDLPSWCPDMSYVVALKKSFQVTLFMRTSCLTVSTCGAKSTPSQQLVPASQN